MSHAFSRPTAASAFCGQAMYQACVPVFIRGLRALAGQVQRASDTSKLSAERLSGVPVGKMDYLGAAAETHVTR
ncbi:hypothetical protein [Bordetella sp. FB-8]|uniref:hypothetical protein n=1 Tax=Bordetella sp. FB-8 TaxID=1159870 RepID=UPI00036508BB|nr:hypothetical protein [Bordetella sp. FB-8]